MACVPNYGQQIRKVRKAFHLTQQEMAGKAGIGVNSLRRYEAGERQPNMAVLSKLAERSDFQWQNSCGMTPSRKNHTAPMSNRSLMPLAGICRKWDILSGWIWNGLIIQRAKMALFG